jgi:hypothetical protein
MGSFSEIVLSFPLRADVGDEVLAAFASVAVPSPDAPPLPTPVIDESGWYPDEGAADPARPWSYDWGRLLGDSMTTVYIGSDQGASMVWRHDHWVITSRGTWKSTPEEFVNNLAILGSVIDAANHPKYEDDDNAGDRRTGFFVGYAKHESEPRPWLLWADGTTLTAENLNPPDFWV